MKKLTRSLIIALTHLCICLCATAQNANTTLSNLVAPTMVNVNLLPNSGGKYNLGSTTKEWKNIYLSGAIYYLSERSLFFDADNTAIGGWALNSNTFGQSNTANGFDALSLNTSGSANVAVGAYALWSNTTGGENTANGLDALQSNTTGSFNIADGDFALPYNTTGNYNTAVGASAMYSNTYGYYNTAMGTLALASTTGSQYNTAVGYDAGSTYDNGYNNVFVGANTGVNGAGYYNDIAIGQGTVCTGVSQARFGNSATISIGGYANWSNISDGRVKKNIKQNVPGLAFINKLQPITYNLDLDAADRIVQSPAIKDKDGNIVAPTQQELDARKAKEQVVYTGFIAQDVEKAAKSLSYDFSGVDAAKNDKDLYGLRYSDFVVPLVKSVQELSKQNDSLKDDNAALHQQVNDLISRMNLVEQSLSQCCASYQGSKSATESTPSTGVARLQQNAPNPFSQNTTIQFYIPSSVSNAMIVITDLSGKTIQQFNHLTTGNGTITISAETLTSGTYQYSLIVNGKVVDSKQMILTK